MSEERVQRRLAAILAADVVGYSKMMEQDEEGTLARLKSLRSEFLYPKIIKNGGRIVKTTGDGILIEFGSAVEAVSHSIDVQQGLAERNAQLPPEIQIHIRMGINVGDIIIDDDDIYGDGVNIAARLEALAEQSGICISGRVYDHVSNRFDVEFEDLGELQLKNISEPQRVYRILYDRKSRKPVSTKNPSMSLPEKPSIAVLPFDNMSNDPDQEYFSDGITEDLITALSRIRQFFVVSRNSTFNYKGTSPDIRQVAKELGVRYVLEGSVRKAGNRIRITVQLIDGETGNHIWAEKFDREFEDIFAVQDEITMTVTGAIQPELSYAEQQRARQKPPDSLDAWDLYQRGNWHCWRNNKNDLSEAKRLLQSAIKLDPEFSLAYAYLAFAIWRAVIYRFASVNELEEAFEAATKAIKLDSRDATAHWAMGVVHLQRRNHGLALEELERAISLNPSFASAYQWLGWTLVYDKRPEEGIRKELEALRLSPNDPSGWGMLLIQAQAYINLGEFQDAEKITRQVKQQVSSLPVICVLLTCRGHLGKMEDTKDLIEELHRVDPKFTTQTIADVFPFRHQEDIDIWVEGLRMAGVPEG